MPELNTERKRTIDFQTAKALDAVAQPNSRRKATRRKRRTNAGGSSWQSSALICLSAALLTACGLSLYAYCLASSLGSEMTRTVASMQGKIQQLDAGISFDSKRQQLLLGIRDEILKSNLRIGLNEAYQYSSLILRVSEKYPSVDPLLFLAIGVVESGYDRMATSPANAMGLYQLWPSTARMLAGMRDWEYTDDMLYNPEMNTELAAQYLDILFSAYHDEKLVLAEYNGGPLNAGYLRAGSHRLAPETRDYITKVLDLYAQLESKFEQGNDVRLKLMHENQTRDGKRLGEPRRTERRAAN